MPPAEIEDFDDGDPRKGAKLVGRRLIGGPENWTPEAQEALRALNSAAADLNLDTSEPLYDPGLDEKVRHWTDEAGRLAMTDPLFAHQVETVTQVVAARRAFEKDPCDGYDLSMVRASVATTLVMYPELVAAQARMSIEENDQPSPPKIIHNLLLLVASEFPREMPSEDEIGHWTPDVRAAVAEWARAVHLYASDNYDVEVPPMPAVLDPEGLK